MWPQGFTELAEEALVILVPGKPEQSAIIQYVTGEKKP